jgi:hypothetical protein
LLDDVAGISLVDAVPQKRRARPPGADIGGSAKVRCFRATALFAVHNTLTPPMSALDGLARRTCGEHARNVIAPAFTA